MADAPPDLDTQEGLRDAVAKLDPDFQGLLERKGVPARTQGVLSNLGVPSISKFAALAEAAGDVRAFAVDHCQLVRGRDVVSIASLVDSWQACTTRMQVRHKAEAEATVAALPAPVNKVEAQDLKVRFEQMYYKMEDKVAPATATLEHVFDQVEAGEWKNMALVQFLSKDDADAEPLAAVIDRSGNVRVKKGHGETKPPKTPEELRQRLKLVGHTYVMTQLKFPNRAVLRGLDPNIFMKLADYLLGEHVHGLSAKDEKGEVISRPSFELVLSYEYQIRKFATKAMNEGTPMITALEEGMKDTTTKAEVKISEEGRLSGERTQQELGPKPSPSEGQLESGTGEKPSVENAKTGEALRSFTLKVLYLFAGAERKTSVVSYLKSMAAKKGWAVDALEVDLKRGDHFDLTQVRQYARTSNFEDQGSFVGVPMGEEIRKGSRAGQCIGTDAYPPKLDEAIAAAIMAEFSGPSTSGSVGGGGCPEVKGQSSGVVPFEPGRRNQRSSGTDPDENGVDKKRKLGENPLDKSSDVRSREDSSGEAESVPIESPARAGHGVPIRCWYKGKERSIHDGGGLCSPGRWPGKQRRQLSSESALGLASCCKGEFLKWVLSICNKKGDAVKEVFWSLAGGKGLTSPFSEVIQEARESLDRKLELLGKSPRRRSGDRCSEVNFRRLAAALEVVEDEDFEWLEAAASSGVRLGVDQTMPRVPAVFEEKVKWNLDFTDEEFRDTLACNYRSAEENAEDIERQVMEEVEAGSIIAMRTEEAEEKYKGRLAVAALGAVPKELGSSVVRIVHDGSYSVDINHRIKVRDRMRFPMVDDAGGVLLQVEKEVEEAQGAMRCSLLYDISRAHKLLPVDEQDWGLQGFRLPAGKQGTVFLHTRGTFGVASAAYHWQRLAACLVRLVHRLGGFDLGLLHLLFADDGWLTALAPSFWRRMLFWLFCLELFEVPIAWKKVRGGLVVHWIGYQIDVQKFTKGISEKKVKWIVEWLERHRASGGVTGRDLKSALGRFSFVAGALQHVRPFLGPIFAWAAVLSPGTFAKFPDAVAVLLDFIQGEVVKEAMTRPRRLESRPAEKFRVDAKAEADLIVIGGWEIPASGRTEDARWLSIVLNRRNAPWAYLKGEPFRNIASLELVAVLTAIMLFGKGWECDMSRTVMSLSASTDNLGNTYVLNHFMSCKYPLSIVVMELAVQLKRLGLEMDLKWIPRGQNSEADSLTNSEFMGFDSSKRIIVEFEDLKFEVMDKLMAKAADLDDEIKLAKSSKEAKGDRPTESMHKRKRGQTRWEDPW
ncbi:unnamed protein product [Cladocopium goreaui]|uniref:Uncharacterized protein n=1 Tax=Cladocopium goreaui TaxID=2562237 RepID=A0A9P1CQM4_9DINO|nr:unnamed protein product [Cladocopium goreaui]